MRTILRFFAVFLVMGLATLTVVLAQNNQNQYDESFDPLKLEEPETNFFQEETQRELQRSLRSDTRTLEDEEESDRLKGYRVQLVATPNYQEADSLISQVREEFQFEANAYLVYDSPNYKIRIGDLRTRGEAEKLRNTAQNRGFRYAWIIPSQINPNPSLTP